ncbi:unnamed protein product [Bemisia tabaci]|uniref:BHLH domain-containing protein n=1 Tax=Bemisia tabaci TaxID=7038 RepID=A0A9P0F005_BEMTA|nr:unnamed protein product [Bemisia tabaci]
MAHRTNERCKRLVNCNCKRHDDTDTTAEPQGNKNYCLSSEHADSPGGNSMLRGGGGGGGGGGGDQEKRIRREIANSNERRRMQSINAGFQSLRTLLPHHEGEKLSKKVVGGRR